MTEVGPGGRKINGEQMTAEPRPGFNTAIPESILTPDRVCT